MLQNIGQFWQLTRELDVRALRADFERPISLSILGSDPQVAAQVAELIGKDAPRSTLADHDPGTALRVGTLGEWAAASHGRVAPDVIVVALGPTLDPVARRAIADISRSDTPLLVVQPGGPNAVVVLGIPEERVVALPSGDDAEAARHALATALARTAPAAALPLARRYPPLRDVVADGLIRDAARANAQFAALSNLPAMLPLVGGIVGDIADAIVLTKNQALLLLKLAGLYGRDLRLGRRLLVEVLPIVGGAFFWRSTARALVGLLPPVLGVVPKTVVAYTGTYVVGAMARYYYQHGEAPPPEVMARLRAEALRLARGPLGRLKGGGEKS